MFCPSCGAPHESGAQFCARCGRPLAATSAPAAVPPAGPVAGVPAGPVAPAARHGFPRWFYAGAAFLVLSLAVTAIVNGGRHAGPTGVTSVGSNQPQQSAKAGIVRGRVLDSAGRPVAGATVDLANTVYTSGATVHTDAGGHYEIQLNGGGYWTVHAFVERQWNGHLYRFGTASIPNDEQFTTQTGATRDFAWKLSGEIAPGHRDPKESSSYWGSTVNIEMGPNIGSAPSANRPPPNGDRLTVNLVPTGPAPDGSTVKAVSYTVTLNVGNYVSVPPLIDIPTAPYTVTARLASGMPVSICTTGCGYGTGTPGQSAQLEFLPSSIGIRPYTNRPTEPAKLWVRVG